MALEQEFKYYKDHQDRLVEEYNDKYVVVKGDKIIGVYDDELTAYLETKKSHKVGTFLIQEVSPGVESYTQTYQSRVCIPLNG